MLKSANITINDVPRDGRSCFKPIFSVRKKVSPGGLRQKSNGTFLGCFSKFKNSLLSQFCQRLKGTNALLEISFGRNLGYLLFTLEMNCRLKTSSHLVCRFMTTCRLQFFLLEVFVYMVEQCSYLLGSVRTLLGLIYLLRPHD